LKGSSLINDLTPENRDDKPQVVLAKNLPKGEIVGYLYVGFNFA